MEKTKLSINKLSHNKGQVAGLPKNPRFIRDDKYKKLLSSLKEDPEMLDIREIVVYPHEDEMVVIAGNMRLRACRELGYKEIPVKLLPRDTPIDKLRAYTIKDNIPYGENDMEILANEWDLAELEDWGLDIPNIIEVESSEIEEDEAPEVDKVSIAKSEYGKIYQLGRHRLMCGSSLEIDDVNKLISGAKINLVITDPPYNVAFNGRSGKHDVIANDDLTKEEFNAFIGRFVDVLNNINPENYYIWCNWKFYGLLQELLEFKTCIVWAKNVFGLGNGYRHQHEFCLFNGNIDKHIKNESDLWEVAKDTKYVHPTQKPLELAARAMRNHSDENNVLDLFGGSGFTLMAAEHLEKNAYVMELDPKYVDVIRKRYWKLINDGEETGWEDATPEIKEEE